MNKKYHNLLIAWYKALADLKAEAARGYLGVLWWIVEPLLFMGAFYLVFNNLFKANDDQYLAFLLCGLVPWKWFASTVQTASNSLASNSSLIAQVYFPKFILPLAVVVANTVKFLLVLGLLLLFLFLSGETAPERIPGLFLVVAAEATFILGCSLILAAIMPVIPELKLLVDNGIMLMFFVSGVFFDLQSRVGETAAWLVDFNPMALTLMNYRSVLLGDENYPRLADLIFVSVAGVFLLLMGLVVLQYLDRSYSKFRV